MHFKVSLKQYKHYAVNVVEVELHQTPLLLQNNLASSQLLKSQKKVKGKGWSSCALSLQFHYFATRWLYWALNRLMCEVWHHSCFHHSQLSMLSSQAHKHSTCLVQTHIYTHRDTKCRFPSVEFLSIWWFKNKPNVTLQWCQNKNRIVILEPSFLFYLLIKELN